MPADVDGLTFVDVVFPGFLFIVGDCQYCRRIDAETLGIFIEMAKTTYELDLTGVGFNC